MMMAQDQSEASSRSTITVFTIDVGAQETFDDREAAARHVRDLRQAADIDIGGGSSAGGRQRLGVGGRAGRRRGRTVLRRCGLASERQHGNQHDKKDRGEHALQCHGNNLVSREDTRRQRMRIQNWPK